MDNQAYDWFSDRYQSIVVSRNRWLVTAVATLVLAALQALALVCVLPLKTSVPFIIQEEKTGAISTIQPVVGNPAITYDEAVKKYFLGRYITARETYDSTDLEANYRAVALLSDGGETRRFEQWAASKASPVVLYGNHTRRSVRIRSISFLGAGAAQVRFTADERTINGVENFSTWIATLGFRFGPPPLSEPERLINPLGFLITDYRVDQEVVP